MIDKLKARSIAVEENGRMLMSGDPLFAPWKRCQVGDPVLVRTIRGEASYWLVPIRLSDQVVGFIRILMNGNVEATGTYYGRPESIDHCPIPPVGLSQQTVIELVNQKIAPSTGETMSQPVYIHDGPRGKEVWLVEISEASKATRWLFVTPSGIYERAAGQLLEGE